jgi:hypothetical protein
MVSSSNISQEMPFVLKNQAKEYKTVLQLIVVTVFLIYQGIKLME